jgi:hypothetical protein
MLNSPVTVAPQPSAAPPGGRRYEAAGGQIRERSWLANHEGHWDADVGVYRNVDDRRERSIASMVSHVTVRSRSSRGDVDREAEWIVDAEATIAVANDRHDVSER